MDSEFKKRYRRRILNDEILKNMDSIREEIKAYKTHMDRSLLKNQKK